MNTMPGLINGVYSYKEASGILKRPWRSIQRWADGYTRKLTYGPKNYRPVLQSEHVKGVLSFPEVIELMYVAKYLDAGVRLEHIRATAEVLAKQFGEYPFRTAKPFHMGSQILQPTIEGKLIRPDIGQLIADFASELKEHVDIDEDLVARYRPPGYHNLIVLDPKIHAGEATVGEYGTPTKAIFFLWKEEKDIDLVAEYFEIEPKCVTAAVRYEGEWRNVA